MSLRSLFITLSLSLSVAACTQDSADVDHDAEAEQVVAIDAKADVASVPIGDYVNLDGQPGEMVTLTLKADGTFARSFFTACIDFPCFPITQTGTYTLSRTKSGATYIRFYDEVGFAGRYQYVGADLPSTGFLALRAAGTFDWFAMFKVPASADTCPPGSSSVNCWAGPVCLPDGYFCAL